jgi:hypothetical protein
MLSDLTLSELVARFVEIGVAQGSALSGFNTGRFNRLFEQMLAVEQELRRRSPDQRTALVGLLDHSNLQVRLNAAKARLTVAPTQARAALESIRKTGWMPQAADAAGCLRNLETGFFKPT